MVADNATAEAVVDQQLALLEQQLAAIKAVVDLIEADFRALVVGKPTEAE